IYKWSTAGQLSTFLTSSGGANGLAFDASGNLIACQGTNGRMVSITPQGVVTVLASQYNGMRFNEPNDLWIDPDGGIYFTDPVFFGTQVQDGQHVYYISPDRSTVTRVITDMVKPNGLVGTPDGAMLYVSDYGAGASYKYTINSDGTLTGKTLFASVGSDGMEIDSDGNVYLTSDDVLVYNPAGTKIETINVLDRPTNLCFGGTDRRTLFITTEKALYSILLRVQGVAAAAAVDTPPTITGTIRTPTVPSSTDAVWITSTVLDDGSVSGVKLTYNTGSGTGATTTPFTETMGSLAVKPWTGATGSSNLWTVTGNYFELRTGANYPTSTTDCGMEYKGAAALNALPSAMAASTNAINAAGTSGYVEFWLQALTLDGTDGWTFQLDSGSGYVTRLSELTGSSHGWQLYHYDLAAGELVSTLKMRFQFTGGGSADLDDRIDLDQITVSVVTGSVPVDVTMYDDGAHGDGAAGDQVYGGQIPAMAAGTTVSYYVTATDNAGLTTCDPGTAPTDKYSYIVGHVAPQLQLNEFLAQSTTFIATTDYPTQTVGLSINATGAMPGYTLLDPMHGKTTYLLDNTGQVVHTWTSAYEPGRTAYLMPNGHLFRACMAPGGLTTGGGEGGRIEERDWDGNLVWYIDFATSNYMMHHDFKVLPNGNVLMLVVEKMLYADVLAAGFNPSLLDTAVSTDGYLLPDSLVEIQPTGSSGGTVVWQWHVRDHLVQDFDSTKANYGVVAQHPELIDANGPGIKIPEFWNHINGIDYNAALDQVMLSARNQNEVWVIDHSTTTLQAAGHTGGTHGKGGDLLYRWGDPRMYDAGTAANEMLYQQHNTQWIAAGCPGAGNILVFNNGLGRPAGAYSTIDEFTSPVDASGNYTITTGSAYGPSALTWTYVASPPANFYSAEISGAERLPNGNTLICEGLTGRIFEVTPAGQIVWQYQDPVTNTGILEQGFSLPADPRGGYMTAVFRALRYPTTYAAFTGRTLTPSGTVEVYPDWIEIRNPGASAIDMGGMYLTNDTGTPKKFQIPTGVSIPAGGYLLFWADNNTSAGSRHMNFTLDSAGGTLSLYDIDGITRIDTITYGAQTTNVSYGRNPDGTGAWQAMTAATPGAANTATGNQAPTDIALSSATVAENLPSGTTVGTLSTTDPDAGNTFTYALVGGTGSTDNASFAVSGSTLLTAASFDYETKTSYSIRIRSTDQGGLYTEKAFTISVTNVNESPVILNTSRTPTMPSPSDAVWITSQITDDGSIASATLTYSTGSGTPTTTTVFTETMCSTAVKPWTGAGAVNAWTVTGTYMEQRTGSNYGAGNACGMEFKGGATLNALTGAMVATTNGISAAGTSGYVEFYVQTLTLDGTDGWTFQLDSGSGYVTRLSELTGSSHAWQKYHYDLAAGELVSGLKMRFQFTGGGAADDDRIDLDQIAATVTSGGTSTATVPMYDDGAHGDGSAGDHVYGGQIPA
ncbi:MAG: SMP-30/gluconolactonase/LRE family protein, partial [Planctomycetota bacterium]|nr:SMP-30/gluconolactonase/LRE family protein [Planctomycetota bacterium]